MYSSNDKSRSPSAACPGWLMTAVAPWGENAEDAYDQGLVEMELGDSRLITESRCDSPIASHTIDFGRQRCICILFICVWISMSFCYVTFLVRQVTMFCALIRYLHPYAQIK